DLAHEAGDRPYGPGAWNRPIVTVEPARESSHRGAARSVPHVGATASIGAVTEPPAGSTTSTDVIAGTLSAHQLLHVTTNHAEPVGGGAPNPGRTTPGVSWTAPAVAGSASGRFLTEMESPLSWSRLTLCGVPVTQQGLPPPLVTTTAPVSEPPAAWKPRKR